MRLSSVYDYDPWLALQHVLAEGRQNLTRTVLLYTSVMGTDGVGYGSYKRIGAHHLEGRTYIIEWVDDAVAIYFLDAIFDCKLHKTVRIP